MEAWTNGCWTSSSAEAAGRRALIVVVGAIAGAGAL